MRAARLLFDADTLARLAGWFRRNGACLLAPLPLPGPVAPMRLPDRPYDQPRADGRRSGRRSRQRHRGPAPRPRGKR